MTYRIEFTPSAMRVSADMTAADIDELIAVIGALSPFLAGRTVQRTGHVEPRAIKAARADKTPGKAAPPRAEKEAKRDAAASTPSPVGEAEPEGIDPGPQEAAPPEDEAPAERIDPPDEPDPLPWVDARLARDERLRELWPTSMTVKEIGAELGMHYSDVSKQAKKLGLPGRHVRYGEPRREPERKNAPPPADPEPAPRTLEPQSNGHVFTMHGVSLTHEAISFDGKEQPITESQYRALHALLRAAPNPIGIPHLVGKVYPGKRKEEAETVFGILVKDLSKNLPSIGLGINDMKGIGIALTGSDA